MLDPFDYKEPNCLLCGGKEFYNPDENAPISTIPVQRIIEKVDGLFNGNRLDQAGRLLEYWQKEAIALNDKRGQLSITDELIGYYRKVGDKEKGLKAVEDALSLIEELQITSTLSAGTILLNCATTKKSFGLSEQALVLYDKAFEIYRKELPPNDEKMAGFYNNKALALIDLGRFDEGEVCYKKAIEIGEGLKDGMINVALTYINLAHAYHLAKRDKKEVDKCLLKGYEILSDESIAQNGYLAYALSKCAPSFQYFGYTLIAKEFMEKSEKIYEGN